MEREDETIPPVSYARDSFDRFYATNPQDHVLDEPEPWTARVWRGLLWCAIVLAVVARCWP